MSKNKVPLIEKITPRYWGWVPFILFTFSAEFLKAHKGKLVNYLGNMKYSYDLKPKEIYAHYPSVDATPTGFRMREVTVESDMFKFCGFGKEISGQEGFVTFRLNTDMQQAVSFNDTLPQPETIKIAIRNNYYPGLNPKGDKWNEGLKEALFNFTKGDAPKLIQVGENFKSLDGKLITASNCKDWLATDAPGSLIARVMGCNATTTATTTTTTTTADTTITTKRDVLPTDW